MGKNGGKIGRLLVVLGLALFVTGCSTGTKKEESKGSDSKVVNLMSATELTSLDTTSMLDFPDAIVQTAAFEGLYALDDKDKIIPAAAKALPKISADGKTYTIELRKDGKWSNGDKVTAKDFIFAWKKLADPKNSRIYNFLVQDTILNGAEVAEGKKSVNELGVKAIDDYTIEIQLKEAKPYFTSILAFPPFFPQNEKYVTSKGEKYGSSSENTLYNGPFVVKNWKQTDLNWDLAKNTKYWDKSDVKSDKIHYEVVKETSTALNLYQADQLDVATLSGVIASENKDNPELQTKPTGTISYIRLNEKRDNAATPLANENLRKALALGIDKETIIKNIVADGSEPIYGLIPSGFVKNPETGEDFRKESGDLMKYNKKEALRYWQAAQKELGNSLTLDLMVNDDSSYKKMAESIQGSLQELFTGLKITVTSLPTETALNTAKEGDYDMFLIYWTPDYQDPISTLNILATDSPSNSVHYSNPTYDKLLAEASTTYANEPEKRWENLIAAEKEVIENTAGTIVLSQKKDAVLQKTTVKGIEYHTFAAPVTLKHVYKK